MITPTTTRRLAFVSGESSHRFARALISCAVLLTIPPANADDLGQSSVKSGKTKPNVLFIVVDDLRCELGCYGSPAVISPNIDRFASSGVLFDRAYCQEAVCNPSRASVMTGLRPDRTKVWDLVTDFRKNIPDAMTIPQRFRKNGYHAFSYGKVFHDTFPDNVSWDIPNWNPEASSDSDYSDYDRNAWQAFLAKMKADGKPEKRIKRTRGPSCEIKDGPENDTVDGRIASAAIGRLHEQAKDDAPFFLAVGFIRPHLPFVVPRKYWDMYRRQDIVLAKNQFLPDGAPDVAFGDRSQGGLYELRDYMDCINIPSPFDGSLDETLQRELKHGYLAAVTHVDAQIGRLLDELKADGLSENTIVVLWGDNGWKLGEHNGWGKQTDYEIDARVPLLIRAPKTGGTRRRVSSLVEFVDIYPTLCDLCDIPIPAGLDGVSLKPLLENPTSVTKDYAISQFPRSHKDKPYMGYTIRTERYRYVEWLDYKSGAVAARELYDHATDPDENKNIAGEPANKTLLDDMSAKLWKTISKPDPAPDGAFCRP